MSDVDTKFSKRIGWTMGDRTARYAMIIDHGKVVYAEKEQSGGEVTVGSVRKALRDQADRVPIGDRCQCHHGKALGIQIEQTIAIRVADSFLRRYFNSRLHSISVLSVQGMPVINLKDNGSLELLTCLFE